MTAAAEPGNPQATFRLDGRVALVADAGALRAYRCSGWGYPRTWPIS